MASTNIFAPQVRIIQPAFVYKDNNGEDNIYIWENVNNSEQEEGE